MKCALYLNVNQIESDPWPFLHNVSLPLEKVNILWWSGTPVWVVVLQLPKAIAYQNTVITSLIPGAQANLTTNGSVSLLSSGGTAMIGCVATTSGGGSEHGPLVRCTARLGLIPGSRSISLFDDPSGALPLSHSVLT